MQGIVNRDGHIRTYPMNLYVEHGEGRMMRSEMLAPHRHRLEFGLPTPQAFVQSFRTLMNAVAAL